MKIQLPLDPSCADGLPNQFKVNDKPYKMNNDIVAARGRKIRTSEQV